MAAETSESLNGSPPAAAARLRRWLIRLAIGLSVLGWLIWKTDWRTLADLFRQAEPIGWCVALFLYAGVQMGLSSSRWRVLAAPLGFAAPWRRYFTLYYMGLFFNLFLPTTMGGDVVRAWALAETKDRRLKAFWSVVSDRLSGLFALVLLACLATMLYDRPLPFWIHATVWSLTVGMIVGYAALPWLGRRSARFATTAQALSVSGEHWRGWLLALGLSLAVQSASIVQIALMGRALGLEVPLLGYAVVVPLVSLLAMLPISVGGMGVREGSLILLLNPFGVSDAGALAVGLSWFAMNLVMGLAGGLVYLFRGQTSSAASPDRVTARPAVRLPLRTGIKPYGPFGGDSAQGRAGERAAAS
jgi:uncharacterized membrane protein YbhN (UPF0104 family)